MGNVTGPGNTPPTNPTTNAGQSQAPKTDTQAVLFGDVLKQCPEGLHRPKPNDEPCTYLKPPSLTLSGSSQPQPSGPDKNPNGDDDNHVRGPKDGLGIDWNKKMPHERDQDPSHGLKLPSLPGGGTYNGGLINDGHYIMFPIGKQAPDPTPEQQQNQTPVQPPQMHNSN
jgi:hypothetical protein